MYKYKIYDLYVCSEIELPSAMPSQEEHCDIVIRYADLSEEYAISQQMRAESEEVDAEGRPYSMNRKYTEDDCILHLFHVGLFRVCGGTCIEYRKTVEIGTYQLEQWILNRCVPMLLIQRRRIVFHGSALLTGQKQMLVSGESGSGKSTLTDALLKQGFGFAADDTICVRIRNQMPEGIGAYPLRRLCADVVSEEDKKSLIYIPDGEKEKYGCDMKAVWPEGFNSLSVMLILVPKEVPEVQVKEITGLEKLKKLIENLYLRETYVELNAMRYIMTDLVKIADKIRIFEIDRPNGKMTVDRQIELIKEAVRG